MNLSGKEKLSYGIGAVGKDMVYMLTAAYILYYFEDVMGISAIFTGVLLLAARVFDALNDPVMGVIVAKTKTKFGKFRPIIPSIRVSMQAPSSWSAKFTSAGRLSISPRLRSAPDHA